MLVIYKLKKSTEENERRMWLRLCMMNLECMSSPLVPGFLVSFFSLPREPRTSVSTMKNLVEERSCVLEGWEQSATYMPPLSGSLA